MHRTCVGIFYIDREQYMIEEAANADRMSNLNDDREEAEVADPVFSWFKNTFKSLVSRVTHSYLMNQTYTHCEIAFFDATSTITGKCKAFGVTKYGLFTDERSFNRGSYRMLQLDLKTEEKRNKVLHWCEKQLKKGAKFDAMGVRRSVCWPRPPLPGHFWCSSFVVSALQKGGILREYRPETLDVDDVICMLDSHPYSFVGISPNEHKKLKTSSRGSLLQLV